MQKYDNFLNWQKLFTFRSYRSDEYRRRHAAIDVAVAFVDFLLAGGEGGDAGCVGGFDDGVEVIGWGDFSFFAEVGEVEGDPASLAFDAGNEVADFNLVFHCIDVHHIVGAGIGAIQARAEGEVDVKAVGLTLCEVHSGDRAGGEEQPRIVDMNFAILIDEALLVDAGKFVVFDMAVAVGFLGESSLDDGA